MDPTTEELLRPSERSARDGREFSDSESDADGRNLSVADDAADASTRGPRLRNSRKRTRCLACCFPNLGKKCRWAAIAAIFASAFGLLVAAGGFGWNKYSSAPLDGQSPPWYPTPKGGLAAGWSESYEKAAKMVAKMTLPEKVNITTGTGWSMGLAVGNTGPALHVGFPGLALQDGPLGIRMADNITAFPAGVTVGSTWNKKLMYERGKAHALEARDKGINILLGPSVGPLGRNPAGGRNWEGFGADPYLQGIAGAETIKGIQDQGIMATIKHFIGNEQEHFRQSWEWGLPNALSSNIDDRTLHEIYAWPFANAVKAGVASVMCSYNMVNNSYACGNSKLLNGILKDELGFQGFVMSDWLAQRSGVASALAGLDMSMPGDGLKWQDGNSLWGPQLSTAVLNGSLPVDRLNDMVVRIVASWFQLGQDNEKLFDRKGPNFSSWTYDKMGLIAQGSPSPQEKVEVNKYVDVQRNHSTLARQIAAEGTVLLKNKGILPLKRNGSTSEDKGQKRADKKISVGIFGEDGGPGKGPNTCDDRGCNQGTLGSGWGSGAVDFPHLVTPVEALTREFDSDQVQISKVLSNDEARDNEKVDILKKQDLCLVFANSDSGEGYLSWSGVRGDRNNLRLQKDGDELVSHVAKNCGGGKGSTIVVIHAVGPVVMERWIDLPGVKAIVLANLPGEESGNALADIVFGDVNPSGKLPYTIGKSLKDYGEGAQVMYLPNGVVPQQDFKEGLYIDYRHFDKFGIEPRYEFGFGLSYTTFELQDLKIREQKIASGSPKRPAPGVQPPTFDSQVPDVSEALFPKGIRKLEKFVYPFIGSADEVKTGSYPYPKGYDVHQPLSEAGGDEGGNPELWKTVLAVAVNVTNTGRVGGQAVAQLYISFPKSEAVEFPVRVLRGFEKVLLDKGETKIVEFNVTRRDLSYWDVHSQNWELPRGPFTLAVGESSRDARVTEVWAGI